MKAILINGYLFWADIPEYRTFLLDDDKIYDEDKKSYTLAKFQTKNERIQANDCLYWDADKSRVTAYLKKHNIS